MSLTPRELAEAVRYNSDTAARTGWLVHSEQVLAALGFQSFSPAPKALALAVADWQASHRPLEVDGKLGPNTWRRMRAAIGASGGAVSPISEPLRLSGSGPTWLQIAQAEKTSWDTQISAWTRRRQRVAELHMTRDEEYFMASPYFGGRVKDPGVVPSNDGRLDWCAAFVNWCLHRAGFSHTGSAGAHSFIVRRLWRFNALEQPRQGCVTVVGNGNHGAHVAFLWSWSGLPEDPGGNVPIVGSAGRRVQILGGNQDQRITVKNERRRLLAARGQNNVTSPYLWPLQGAANCNHLPPTEHGHYCGRVHSS